MTVTVTMTVPEHEKYGINVYKCDSDTGNVVEQIKINPGETRPITVWREVYLEIYEQGVGGSVEPD